MALRVAGGRLRWPGSVVQARALRPIFVLSWLAQPVTGRIAVNEEHLRELQDPADWLTYVTSAEFWNRTLQNWQSELLVVASTAILAVYLRQRGSPESKPVGATHTATGIEG